MHAYNISTYSYMYYIIMFFFSRLIAIGSTFFLITKCNDNIVYTTYSEFNV